MRLQVYTLDETLGTLVWACNTTGAWCPGEALDPHYLPPAARTIAPLAAAVQINTCFVGHSLVIVYCCIVTTVKPWENGNVRASLQQLPCVHFRCKHKARHMQSLFASNCTTLNIMF